MSILNHSDLLSDISTYIFNNGAQAITGNILQQRLNNIADSAVNKLGDTGITGVLRYNTVLSISNSADLVHKNYVDTTLSTALLDYLNKDGSTPLTGDLNFNLHNATNIVGLYGEVDGFGRNASETFASNGEVVINSYWGGPFPYQLYINSGGIGIMTNASSNKGYLHSDNLTANRIIQLPDKNDTLATLSDISGFGSGTVTSVGITGSDFSISGSPVTTSGNIGLTLATVNSNIGTFNNVTVNGKGLITAASNVSYALQSTVLDINGDDHDLSTNRQWRTGLADTGVLNYAGASAASSTTINVGAVDGYIINNETDPLNPTFTHVTYAGASGVSVSTIGTGLASYLLLNSAGVLVFQNTFPTSTQRKSMIYLSKIGHPAGTITTVGNEPDFILSPTSQLRDLTKYIGFINSGVVPSANGANLNFNISSGTAYRANGNFVIDKTIPNEISIAAQTPASFLYRTQTGAGGGFVSLIDPTTYDNAGTSTAIAGSTNQATNQRIYLVPGLGYIVQKGQTIYATLNDAIAAATTESFVVYPSLINNAILIGILSVTKGATALNNTTTARFFITDKFGQVSGATSGVTTATLQTAYNNSLTPEILTDSTRGALSVKRGSASDTDIVFEVLNNAGTSTYTVAGNGTINNGSLGWSVKWSGATGDGVTDDTTAINNAITSAGVNGTLYFPAGTYIINQEIKPLAGQKWISVGYKGAVIKQGASFAVSAPISALSLGNMLIMVYNVNDVYIEGFSFTGISPNTIVSICTHTAQKTIIKRCYSTTDTARLIIFTNSSTNSKAIECISDGTNATNGSHIIEINKSDDCHVEGCILSNSHANGIEIYQNGSGVPIKGTKILNTEIYTPLGAGIATFGDYETLIEGCTISGSSGHGISSIRGEVDTSILSLGGRIVNCIIKGCAQTSTSGTTNGINFSQYTNRWTIEGCTIKDNGHTTNNSLAVGVAIGGDYNIIKNNPEISGSCRHGIHVQANHCEIEGNGCHNNSTTGTGNGYGIMIQSSTYITVSGNVCTDTRGTKLQDWGLFVHSSSSNITHIGNNLQGNRLGAYTDFSISPIIVEQLSQVLLKVTNGADGAIQYGRSFRTTKASLLTMTLPSTCPVDEEIEIIGHGAGGWKIAQNASQTIRRSAGATTTGIGGSVASTNQYDTIRLRCIVANLDFVVVNSSGTLTFV